MEREIFALTTHAVAFEVFPCKVQEKIKPLANYPVSLTFGIMRQRQGAFTGLFQCCHFSTTRSPP